MNKLKRAAIKLKEHLKQLGINLLIVSGAGIALSLFSFAIGLPLIYFGIDITRDDFGFYQKCFSMGFLSFVFLAVLSCAVAAAYQICRAVKKFWDEI